MKVETYMELFNATHLIVWMDTCFHQKLLHQEPFTPENLLRAQSTTM